MLNDKSSKKHVHLVCVGHFDHGKSTLLGRLFFDTGNIGDKEMENIKTLANELGRRGFEFAFVMDQIKEERARGITIGLAHKKLITSNTSFTFADAPGHRDFVKNMLIGASEADAAILVVAADEGIMSQTEQHLFLCKMLGLPRVIVVLNKMDIVDYEENKYHQVKSSVEDLLKKVGYNSSEVPIIPCSALLGENIARKSKKMPWYSGPTFLEILKNLPERKIPTDLPLRLPIQDIYEIKGQLVVIGRLVSGVLKTGDEIIVVPQNKGYSIEKIYITDKQVNQAEPDDNVSIHLKNLGKDEIKRADIIGPPHNKPVITNEFIAQIIVLNHPGEITNSYECEFDLLTEQANCTFSKILKKIDSQSGETIEENPKTIAEGDSALVRLQTKKPIYIETQNVIPYLSNFRLVKADKIIAFGICTEIKQ